MYMLEDLIYMLEVFRRGQYPHLEYERDLDADNSTNHSRQLQT